jgi:hypothetical protein
LLEEEEKEGEESGHLRKTKERVFLCFCCRQYNTLTQREGELFLCFFSGLAFQGEFIGLFLRQMLQV